MDFEISQERYEQLVEAEIKLKVLKDVLGAEDDVPFGYTEAISNVIDAILGIVRNEK